MFGLWVDGEFSEIQVTHGCVEVLKYNFYQIYAAGSTPILQTHCQSKHKLLFKFLTSKFLCRYFGFVDRNATRTSK